MAGRGSKKKLMSCPNDVKCVLFSFFSDSVQSTGLSEHSVIHIKCSGHDKQDLTTSDYCLPLEGKKMTKLLRKKIGL
jgi:hypothetical protein